MNSIQNVNFNISQLPVFVSTKLLAELLGYKQQTIRAWLSADKLPEGLVRPEKIGNRNTWHRDDVYSFISSHFKNMGR